MCQENYSVCQPWRNLECTLCYENHSMWHSKIVATVLSWNCKTLWKHFLEKALLTWYSSVLKSNRYSAKEGPSLHAVFCFPSNIGITVTELPIPGMSLSAANPKKKTNKKQNKKNLLPSPVSMGSVTIQRRLPFLGVQLSKGRLGKPWEP